MKRVAAALAVCLAVVFGFVGLSYATIFPVKGRKGDAVATVECPKGEYLIGINARAGDWVDQMQAVCAVFMKDQTFKVIREMPKHGGMGGGPVASDCGARSALTGWGLSFTEDNLQVKHVLGRCQN